MVAFILTGQEQSYLEIALRSAFSVDSLAQLVRHSLDQNLEDIILAGNREQMAFRLVEWAKDHGKLDDLVTGAFAKNPGNQELQNFYLYYLMKPANFSFDELQNLYLNSIGIYHNTYVIKEPSNIYELIETLASLPIIYPDNTLPIFKFVGLLLARNNGSSLLDRNKIREFLMLVANQRNLNPGVVDEHMTISKELDEDICDSLLVFVLPISHSATKSDYWDIKISCRTTNRFIPLFSKDSVSIDDMPSLILDALNHLSANQFSLDNLSLQFFLPYQLLTQEFDQIELPIPIMPQKLCVQHSVIIRSLERAITPYMYSQCKKKWQLISRCEDNPSFIKITSHQNLPSASSQLQRQLQLSDWVCLGLSEIPVVAQKTLELVGAAISGGIPIIIWSRQKVQEITMSEIIKRRTLIELPKTVYDERVSGACSESQHMGNHLTLIWDDPNQIPPISLLKFHKSLNGE